MAKVRHNFQMTKHPDNVKLAIWDDLLERAEEGDRIIAELRHDLADRDAKLATITAELGRLLALANVKVRDAASDPRPLDTPRE